MRRTWPYFVAVAVVGALAGAAIAGRPTQTDSFVVDPAGIVTTTTVDLTGTTIVTTTSVVITTNSPTTTAPAATTAAPTGAPAPTAPIITAPASPAPTTTTTTTTAGTDGVRARADVRVVLANGDGRFDLVGRNADRLLALGYVTIDQIDVPDRPPVTTIYVRPGFDEEAVVLVADLQTPNADIVPLPDTPVTGSDDLGDLIVVLGPDALR